MKNNPTFSDIQSYSEKIEKNKFFTQYMNPELADRYDSNYILLHYSPSLPEFQIIESMYQEFQVEENQQHLKFYWPEDTGIQIEVLEYLSAENYELGRLELMVLEPNIEVIVEEQKISFEVVTEETFERFLSLNYKEDLKISAEFVEHLQKFYPYQFEQENTTFLIATIHNKPVGSLALITSDYYLELDNVLTDQAYRKQGVAREMIQQVATLFNPENKPIILVADAEDTPKEFYKKVGFKRLASQISAQKVGIHL